MGRLQKAWAALRGIETQKAANNAFPPLGIRFDETGKPLVISSDDNKAGYIQHGYNYNDVVYSIIFAISEKVRIAPWNVYQVKDEAALKAYTAITSKKDWSGDDWVLAKKYRSKALELYDGDMRLNELIARPNDEQETFNDLVADSSILKLITGDRFIYGQPLNKGANQGKPGSLELMPSDCVTIVVDRTKWPMKVVGYMLTPFGLNDIPASNVMHDKYFNAGIGNANGLDFYGHSPLKSAHNLIDRSNAETTAAIASYQNLGPRNILFTDDPRLAPDQAKVHVQGIKSLLTAPEYRGAENNTKFATSAYKMGVAQLGLSPADLQITESEWSTVRRMCNVFRVSSALFNDPQAKTYNNQAEAQKDFTTSAALPQLNSFRGKINPKLRRDWGYAGKNIFIDYDMNVFPELQEDLGKKWLWVGQLPTTNRRKLEMMGEDVPEGYDDFMDKILISSGQSTSEDYEQTEIDRALEAGDGGISDTEGGA